MWGSFFFFGSNLFSIFQLSDYVHRSALLIKNFCFFQGKETSYFCPKRRGNRQPNPRQLTLPCILLFFLFAAISAILLSVPKPIFFYNFLKMKFPCPVNTCFQFSIDEGGTKQDEDDLKNDFRFSSWPFNVHLE